MLDPPLVNKKYFEIVHNSELLTDLPLFYLHTCDSISLPLPISVHNNILRLTSHIRFIMRFMHLVLLAWARLVQREYALFSSCDFFISSLQIGGGFKEHNGLPLSDYFFAFECSFQEKLAKIIGLQ